MRLLAGIPAKINLIPFNPWPGAPYECSDWEQIERFAEVVNKAGYASPVRTPRGRDINAACGQLRSASVKQRASDRARADRCGIERQRSLTARVLEDHRPHPHRHPVCAPTGGGCRAVRARDARP